MCGSTIVRRFFAFLGVSSWLIGVAIGVCSLHWYESTPGREGRSPTRWPSTSIVRRSEGRSQIVMAIHPRCPCTQSSLQVLAELFRNTRDQAPVHLLVYRPTNSAKGWAGTKWHSTVESLSNVTMVDDPGGIEANRFGLATSGAVAAFDEAGALRFSGGLTAGRGLADRSEGTLVLERLFEGKKANRASCSVFGCPMIAATGDSPVRGDRP